MIYALILGNELGIPEEGLTGLASRRCCTTSARSRST